MSVRAEQPGLGQRANDRVGALVRRHQRGLWRFLRGMGCPADAAEELVQDAFLILLDRPEVDEDRVGSMLRGIVRNLWLRRHRDDNRREALVADAAEVLWCRDGAADDGDAWIDALRACVAALPERARHALERVYRDGATRKELAQELGIGEHGVRSMLNRARRRLHDCVTRRRER